MKRESEIEHFDHLVDAFAALVCYQDRIPQLEAKIHSQFVHLMQTRPHFDDIASLLGRRLSNSEVTLRRTAWVAQHALKSRAYCVGNLLVSSRQTRATRTFTSPLLEQLQLLGFAAQHVELGETKRTSDRGLALHRIDCLLVDVANSTVYPVMGRTMSELASFGYSPTLQTSDSLFAPKDREVYRIAAPAKAARTLSLATDLLRHAFPMVNVRPVFAVLADAESGWGYQLHDLSDKITNDRLTDKAVELDSTRVIASSQQYCREGNDLDDLEYLPRWPNSNYLDLLPVDRCARSLMVLSILWGAQKQARKLVSMSISELASQVEKRFLITYTRDLRRHDIEDCLERGGYVERPRFEASRFSLTARGVARILMFRRLSSPTTIADSDHGVHVNFLELIQRQAERWSHYRSGVQVS